MKGTLSTRLIVWVGVPAALLFALVVGFGTARSYQQVVDLESDAIFDYPFVYAVQVESWTFSDEQASRLRDYLLKGGFLMVDDFHGTQDWESFLRGMRMVLPELPQSRSPAAARS